MKRNTQRGFTLVELLVAIAISALALVMLSRLFSVSLRNYTMQEQLADMNQNARYTITELSNIIMQAGSDLQIMGLDTTDHDTIILPDGGNARCSGFTIKINPRGGLYQFMQKTGSPKPVCTLFVDDAAGFRFADMLQRLPGSGTSRPIRCYSLKSVDTDNNSIIFAPADSFLRGDAVCSFVKVRYFLNGTDLCADSSTNVIAENIDSLSIVFLDKNYNETATWGTMRAAKMYVRARTSLPEPRYNGYSDHYHRVELTYEFRMRNRVDEL